MPGRSSIARESPPASSLHPMGRTSSSATRPASSISAAIGISAPIAASVRCLVVGRRPAASIAPAATSPTATTSHARPGSDGSSIIIQCSAPHAASSVNPISRATARGSSGSPASRRWRGDGVMIGVAVVTPWSSRRGRVRGWREGGAHAGCSVRAAAGPAAAARRGRRRGGAGERRPVRAVVDAPRGAGRRQRARTPRANAAGAARSRQTNTRGEGGMPRRTARLAKVSGHTPTHAPTRPRGRGRNGRQRVQL